ELFFQFAAQGIPRLFPLFDLPPGEFPLHGHRLMSRALAYQDGTVFDDQGRYHVFHHWVGASAATGAREGSIQLVNVKANAATPAGQISSSTWVPKPRLSSSEYMRGWFTRTKLSCSPCTMRNRVSGVRCRDVSGRKSCRTITSLDALRGAAKT